MVLGRVRAICEKLAETKLETHGDHAKFTVKGKTFAYFLDNHHGDGIVGINTKVGPGENTSLVAMRPDVFYMPAYIGSRGWVGYRLDVAATDWEEAEELLRDSYRRVAPRKLAATVI